MSEINWLEIFIGVVLTLLLTEISGFIPRLAEFIARKLAKQLPELAEEREMEWLAILDDVPSPWSKLFRASGWAFVAIREQSNPWFTLIDLLFKTFQLIMRPVMLFTFIMTTFSVYESIASEKYYLIPLALVMMSVSLALLPKSKSQRSPDFEWMPSWEYPNWAYILILLNLMLGLILEAIFGTGILRWLTITLLAFISFNSYNISKNKSKGGV